MPIDEKGGVSRIPRIAVYHRLVERHGGHKAEPVQCFIRKNRSNKNFMTEVNMDIRYREALQEIGYY